MIFVSYASRNFFAAAHARFTDFCPPLYLRVYGSPSEKIKIVGFGLVSDIATPWSASNIPSRLEYASLRLFPSTYFVIVASTKLASDPDVVISFTGMISK